MKLYSTYADYWHLFTAPEEYEEQVNLFMSIADKYKKELKTILELGSGGGNNAFYMKRFATLTLSDLAPEMLNRSKVINPECEHLLLDMRAYELGRCFDMIFIHDAIMHIRTEEDLLAVFKTAHQHLNEGGLLLVVPYFFKETFQSKSCSGGYDEASSDKGLRYLEWVYDPNSNDDAFTTDFVYIIRKGADVVVEHDHVVQGLFSKETWQKTLQKAGFKAHFEALAHEAVPENSWFAVVGCK